MKKIGGIILTLIGGVLSILLGIFITVIYPVFFILGELFVLILKIITILGGIISLLGALLSIFRPKLAWIIILIGGIIAGGNMLTIIGAILIKKHIKYEKVMRVVKNDYTNLEWLKEQYYDLKKRVQDIADDQGVSMMKIREWIDKIENDKNIVNEIE
ncbi:MAG: hypothetical protein ACFE8M_07485 [Candidatus Hermodarchaeota archaeon]